MEGYFGRFRYFCRCNGNKKKAGRQTEGRIQNAR